MNSEPKQLQLSYSCLWLSALARPRKKKNLNYTGNLGLLNSIISGPLFAQKYIFEWESADKVLNPCFRRVCAHVSSQKCSIRYFFFISWRGGVVQPVRVNLNRSWSGSQTARLSCVLFHFPASNKWLNKCSKRIALLDSWSCLHPDDGDTVWLVQFRLKSFISMESCCALIVYTRGTVKKKVLIAV